MGRDEPASRRDPSHPGADQDVGAFAGQGEARYREIIENAPVGIVETTLDGQIIAANPAFAALFGYASVREMTEAVNRRSIAQVVYRYPGQRGQIVREVIRADDAWRTFETTFRRKDDSSMEATLHFRQHRGPLAGDAHLLGFICDVTDERESRRTLERTAQLLEEAERLAHLGSWQWDVGSDLCRFSREWQRIHGCGRETMALDEALLVVHPDDRTSVEAVFRAAAAYGTTLSFTYRTARRDDGGPRHLELIAEPLPDGTGTVAEFRGATLDVTERVAARAALEEREERLTQALDGTVAALVRTVEMRDPYTAGHQERVARLAEAIARHLGWPDERVRALRMAALLHDIGKIVVPAEILAKPGRLTTVEFDLIRQHPQAGHDILSSITFPWPVAAPALQHHERLDGSGYPHGLSGEEIAVEARILAVADVVEAMASHRPFRPSLGVQAALEEIERHSSRLYDAGVVKACLAACRDGTFAFE